MKKNIVTLLILAIAVFSGCSSKEIYRLVKVDNTNGEVVVNRSEEHINAFSGMKLIENDYVNVGNDSDVLLLVDSDKHIAAEENTEFRINAEGTIEKGSVTIELINGKALFTIDNKLNSESTFEVKTSNATMSVRGTSFSVTYYPDIVETDVEVFTGVVVTTYDTGEAILQKGESIIIRGIGADSYVAEAPEKPETEAAVTDKLAAAVTTAAINEGASTTTTINSENATTTAIGNETATTSAKPSATTSASAKPSVTTTTSAKPSVTTTTAATQRNQQTTEGQASPEIIVSESPSVPNSSNDNTAGNEPDEETNSQTDTGSSGSTDTGSTGGQGSSNESGTPTGNSSELNTGIDVTSGRDPSSYTIDDNNDSPHLLNPVSGSDTEGTPASTSGSDNSGNSNYVTTSVGIDPETLEQFF